MADTKSQSLSGCTHRHRVVWTKGAVAWAVLVSLMGVVKMGTCQFGSQCEEIKIPMCKNMPYNLTRLPNLLHHSTQENAQLAVEQFELLRWTKCSSKLEFFVCSMYAPICAIEFQNEAIPPCRSVCEGARKGCEPLLARFNIPWPSNLECSSLPLYDRGVCITPEAIISSSGAAPRPTEVEAPCECKKERKLRKKVYNTKRFHYVIRGKIKSVETFGSLTLTTATVTEVVKQGRVGILVGRDIFLWTNRSCECPPLMVDADYLILGWEDFGNSRLLYLDGSLAVPYRRRYVRKIKSWEVTTPDAPSVDSVAPSVPNDTKNSLPTFYPESMQVASSRKKKKKTRRREKSDRRRRRGRKGSKKKNKRKRKQGRNSTETEQ